MLLLRRLQSPTTSRFALVPRSARSLAVPSPQPLKPPPVASPTEREEAALRLKNALAEQKKKPLATTLSRAPSTSKPSLSRAPSSNKPPLLVKQHSSLVRVSPHIKQISEVLPPRNFPRAVLAAGRATLAGLAKVPGLLKWAASWTWQSIVEAYRTPAVISKWWKEGRVAAKHGVEHVVTGFKVLWLETKTTTRLLAMKIGQNRALTRRENQQLARTYRDMLSMVPFLVILIVPFLEFALPVLLKVFPNLLPSSFQTTSQKQDMQRTISDQRTEIASYMQEMVADAEKRIKKAGSADAEQTINALVDFVDRSRTNRPLDPESIPILVKVFSDELAIERMSRRQLQLLCRYMGASVLGSDDYLRYSLLAKMRALRADDLQIYAEGVNDLTLDELKKAALDRGMRADSDVAELYREQLARWIELSVVHNVSPTMIILSRAFAVTSDARQATLRNVLSSLGPEIVQDALSESVDEAAPGSVPSAVLAKAKLESVKGQNELIAEEERREAAQKKAR